MVAPAGHRERERVAQPHGNVLLRAHAHVAHDLDGGIAARGTRKRRRGANGGGLAAAARR